MRPYLSNLAAVALTLSFSSASGAVDPVARVNQVPPLLEGKVQALTSALTGDGYAVARGYWKLFGVPECKWAIQGIGNCLGNNPTAPYALPVLPHWRDEYVDRTLHLALGPVRRGFTSTFRLAEREAIVVLAKLPPEAAYFSLQTYVFTRKDAIDPLDPIYLRVQKRAPEMLGLLFDDAPDPSRVIVFASLGNSNNDVVVERQTGMPAWGQEAFFIITPDAAMKDAITEALLGVGVPEERVFFEPVSPSLAVLGLHRDADDFLPLIRYALPQDGTLGEAWRQDLPMAVLRVRDMGRSEALEPYPIPEYDARTVASEKALEPGLNQLAGAVRDAWGKPDACVRPFVAASVDIDLVGQHCLERPMNCLGDSQDTDTYRVSPSFEIDPAPTAVAIVGALGTETGNATYVSLAVNRFSVLEGVVNLTQEQLAGSATGFDTVENAGKLYLLYLARSCAGLPIPDKAYCQEIAPTDIPVGEEVKVIQRNYVRPGTARGADTGATVETEQLLRPRLVALDQPPCPPPP